MAAASAPCRTPSVPEVYRAQPIWYISNRFSVVGHDAVVRWPAYSRVMDFELEVAIVIGKGGTDIPDGEGTRPHLRLHDHERFLRARSAAARDGRRASVPTKGKSFDTGNAIGPWIVTADEIRRSLCASGRGAGQWRGMGAHHHRRHAAQLRANPGVHFTQRDAASGRDHRRRHGGRMLRPGAGTLPGRRRTIELDVSGIGVLRNKVVANAQAGTLVTRV